jgi:hypothetical protein
MSAFDPKRTLDAGRRLPARPEFLSIDAFITVRLIYIKGVSPRRSIFFAVGCEGECFGMTTSPAPEQSATAILDIFKSQNCIAGDPLKISYVKAQFLENHGSVAQYDAGLMYAEDNGWLEVSPGRDMFTLTDVGFAKI